MSLEQLPRLSAPTLVVLTALMAGCAGATTQRPPDAASARPEVSPVEATPGAPASPLAVGYMADGPGPDTLPGVLTADEGPSRWSVLLMRDVELRRAVDDVQRLGILAGLREVEPGQLHAAVGPEFGISSAGYNLRRLLRAYKGTVEWDPGTTITLWQGERKVGAFDDRGLTLSP